MLTDDRPAVTVPLHAGNKGYKGPAPYVEERPIGRCAGLPDEYYDPVIDVMPHAQHDRSNTPADGVLPNDAQARKAVPAGAILDYFDSAIVEIARALQDGHKQHNLPEPLHWARGQSADHASAIIRHYLERGKLSISPTGAVIRHSTYLAIRALMLLQEELEANGAPLSRGSKLPEGT